MRKIWLAIGWLIVAIVIVLSLTPHPPKMDFSGSDKIGHFLSYAILMGWFMQIYTRPAYPRLAVAFIALGIGIELVQRETGFRSFEYLDMAADTAGVCIAWLLGQTVFARGLELIERHVFTRR